MTGVVLVFLGLVGWLFAVVVQHEYSWWAPRLAHGVAYLTSFLTPRKLRSARRNEWFAEIDKARVEGAPCVLYALLLPRAAIKIRLANRRQKRSDQTMIIGPFNLEEISPALVDYVNSLAGARAVLHVTGGADADGGQPAVISVAGLDWEGKVYVDQADEPA